MREENETRTFVLSKSTEEKGEKGGVQRKKKKKKKGEGGLPEPASPGYTLPPGGFPQKKRLWGRR